MTLWKEMHSGKADRIADLFFKDDDLRHEFAKYCDEHHLSISVVAAITDYSARAVSRWKAHGRVPKAAWLRLSGAVGDHELMRDNPEHRAARLEITAQARARREAKV
jgi:hypothetical protein